MICTQTIVGKDDISTNVCTWRLPASDLASVASARGAQKVFGPDPCLERVNQVTGLEVTGSRVACVNVGEEQGRSLSGSLAKCRRSWQERRVPLSSSLAKYRRKDSLSSHGQEGAEVITSA